MRHNPFKIVSDFEETVADYTGSKYAVAIDSCTNAIFLCCKYLNVKEVTIPNKTYISPAISIIHAGGKVVIEDKDWLGIYQLKPYPIFDAAKRFTSGMYIKNSFMCLSFHIKKQLKLGKGGMILTDSIEARDWFRKACYEGRSRDKGIAVDDVNSLGWNMYMTPQTAANGLALMQNISENNEDLPNNYRELSTFNIFKGCKKI